MIVTKCFDTKRKIPYIPDKTATPKEADIFFWGRFFVLRCLQQSPFIAHYSCTKRAYHILHGWQKHNKGSIHL